MPNLARWSCRLTLPLLSSIVASCLMGSCIVVLDGEDFGHSVRGSGVRAEEQRAVAEFHAIDLETNATVVVRLGAGSALHLSGDDNLLPLVETRVENGVLSIDLRDSASFRCGLELEIETPALDRFDIEGSGDVCIEGLAGERIELGIEGSGTLRAGGQTHDLVASIEGSGSLELAELAAVHAHLSIEGSGSMDVRVAEALRYSIEGSGEIRYAGDPEVGGTIDGSGDVAKHR